VVFEVGDDAQTDVVVSANLEPDGWNTNCTTGVAIPGTDAAAAVAPDDMWMPEPEMSVPPVVDATEWLDDVSDVEVARDGSIIVAAPGGVASLDAAGEWTLVDVTGLPEGSGLDDGWPGRMIDMIAIGPEGELWVAGSATSAVDDQEFGGTVDEWIDARLLAWIALRDCAAAPCTWHVFTSDEIPELGGGVGDIAVSDEGTVYASVGENQLLVHNGTGWVSHVVPDLPTGWNGSVSPWSGSLAIQTNGVVWAGTNAPGTGGRGLYSFDGNGFTQHSADDGLPSNETFQVAAAPDGSIWVATDALYNDPATAAPDAAAGVARYDGTEWTTYTIDDGLLSNDAFIATGPDGTVWAIHSEIPPYGYARFDGTTWTTYPTDRPVGGFRAAVDADGTLWTTANGELISFNGTATAYASPFTRP
jgi:hypothetical protein